MEVHWSDVFDGDLNYVLCIIPARRYTMSDVFVGLYPTFLILASRSVGRLDINVLLFRGSTEKGFHGLSYLLLWWEGGR